MSINQFFSVALNKAASMSGKPGRMLLLLSRLALKLKEVNWNSVSRDDVKDKVVVFGRMIKAFATGEYKAVSMKTILLLLAAIIYFVNPVDFIPDFIPVAGLVDDFSILLWIFNTANTEINKFLTWEQSKSLT
jgi:uncharacterized membrane protein YkvA (DUF1232 family)